MNTMDIQQDDVQEDILQEEEELETEEVDENAEGEPEEVAEDEGLDQEEEVEEEIDENVTIPIFLPDENGEEVEREIAYSDISKAIVEHEQMRQYIMVQDKALRDAAPIMDKVNNHKILQDLLWYLNDPKYSTWSDTQLRAGLAALWSQEHKPPTFDNKEDEINYRVEQLLKEKLSPIEEQLKVSQQQQYRERVYANNNALLSNALASAGISSPTEQQVKAMLHATTDLFPGVDLNTLTLNKLQAEAIVKLAGIKGEKKERDSEAQKKQKIANALKLVKRPKIMPGKSVKVQTKEVVPTQKLDGVSTAESLRRKNDLFDSVKK